MNALKWMGNLVGGFAAFCVLACSRAARKELWSFFDHVQSHGEGPEGELGQA